MYAAIGLWCIAQGLLLENWLAGWAAFVAFAILYFRRTPVEEKMMLEQFGNNYKDYVQATGKVIPKILNR